jgi:hypothetical protein
MSNTLVVQSHQSPLPYAWINHCLDSVRDWCNINQYEYQFMGDELFELLPKELFDKTYNQRVIATDLARLYVIQDYLGQGYDTVIWLDADFLIFNPEKFVLPDQFYAVGREVWIQYEKDEKLKVYKKVHNAFLMFRKNNSFLDFYVETATRLLSQNSGTMPPQFIGPKLLTALHNITILPVMESAGMFSPVVIKDMVKGEGLALDLFQSHSQEQVAGANLCISCCNNNEISAKEIEQLIDSLLN